MTAPQQRLWSALGGGRASRTCVRGGGAAPDVAGVGARGANSVSTLAQNRSRTRIPLQIRWSFEHVACEARRGKKRVPRVRERAQGPPAVRANGCGSFAGRGGGAEGRTAATLTDSRACGFGAMP